MRRALFPLLLVTLFACHDKSPTEPADSRLPHGRLAGVVTIGPNCPHEEIDKPCPTPPSAYAERKVLVYDEGKTKLIATVDIDSGGLYVIDLLPAKYTVDIKPVGIDRSADVPVKVDIVALNVTKLDIRIDTGLR